MATFGDELKKAIKKKKITQQQLANKIGVARSSISYYVHNKSEPPFGTIVSLCKELDIDLNQITGLKTFNVSQNDFDLLVKINQLPAKEYNLLIEIIESFSKNYS